MGHNWSLLCSFIDFLLVSVSCKIRGGGKAQRDTAVGAPLRASKQCVVGFTFFRVPSFDSCASPIPGIIESEYQQIPISLLFTVFDRDQLACMRFVDHSTTCKFSQVLTINKEKGAQCNDL